MSRPLDWAIRWNDYLTDWVRWNHLRTAAALGAAGLLTVALRVS